MSTPLHRTLLLTLSVCAVLSVGLLPQALQAQESDDAPATTSLLNLYPTEGVPGGESVVGDFVIGPGKIDIEIRPGQSKIVEMTVTNRTGERRRFNLAVEDVAGSNDVTTPIVLLGNDRGPYSVRDYISFPHATFDLEHNQRARIPVTISLPPNAEPGGLYGSILVDTVAIEAEPGDTAGTVPQSAIIARVGTIFFITVPGAVEKAGILRDFTTVPAKKIYQSGPIEFGILFENRGSIHLAPYGELRITNLFDEEVGYLPLEQWFVLPQSLRLREVTWDRELLFGRYTATVSINRSYDDAIDVMSYTFWVLPWKPVLAIFIAIFLILFGIRYFVRTFEFKRKS